MMKFLYHYTSLQALNGIIPYNASKLVLHASVASSMNDPTEVQNGYDCLLKGFPSNGINESLKQKLIQQGRSSLFITSFSSNSDSLPLWISYAENGTGICLKFRRDVIEDAIKGTGNLMDVVYSNEDKNNNRKEILEKNRINRIDSEQINMYIFSCKNSIYSFEKEIRCCFVVDSDSPLIKKRLRSDGVISYYVFRLPFIALSQIIIGPKASKQTIQLIREYLPNSMNVKILQSKIPYR